ncbi:hypothetical protein J2TS4_11720 [Paenibacillus sp. J2TS4]|nr:hypothetical protein J2TS4_11720 [Paenibacillus sp. J2TS4]
MRYVRNIIQSDVPISIAAPDDYTVGFAKKPSHLAEKGSVGDLNLARIDQTYSDLGLPLASYY